MNFLNDNIVRKGAWATGIGLGGFLIWAALVPLDEGVAATGQVVVEADRQKIQHLEGGIVAELHVREGAMVEEGDVLVRLDTEVTGAERAAFERDLLAQEAALVRLDAMAGGATGADFSALLRRAQDDEGRAAVERERAALSARASAYREEVALLEARISGIGTTIASKRGELAAQDRAIAAGREERALAKRLVESQLGTRDRLSSIEGNLAGIEASRAAGGTQIAQLRAEARELRQQIALARSAYRQEAAKEGLQIRREVEALRARLVAADDAETRGLIRAPASGKVINLAANTLGGVVRPGETVLEIVPTGSTVLAEVRLPAQQRNHVYEGLEVRASISAYQDWRAEPLPGEVVTVSGDLKTDEATGEKFYEATVAVDLAANGDAVEALPGMPVQAFIFSGESRTTLSYLFAPLSESLYRASRAR